MTAVAKTMAEIKVEVRAIEAAQGKLSSPDLPTQKAALAEIALGGMNAAAKADEIISQVTTIKTKLEKYLRGAERA